MSTIFKSKENFDTQLGILACEMEYIRMETISLIEDLSDEDLDFHFDEHANSIGMLLMHISALEFKFLLNFLHKRPFTLEERQKYGPAMPMMMHQKLVHSNSKAFYIDQLALVRTQTFEALEKLKDSWLYEEVITPNGMHLGNHFFQQKHILFDEICHQGQIKIIRKRLQQSKL